MMDAPMPNVTIYSSEDPAILTKRWRKIGGVPRRESTGWITRGTAHPRSITSPEALAEGLAKLQPHHAISWSIPVREGPQRIVPHGEEADGAIARLATEFFFPSRPGWMMLDYDPHLTTLSRDELIDAIAQAWPEVRSAPSVWACSSSSYIYDGDVEVSGLSGQRLYILVNDASDIPRAGRVLFERLWLRGHGYIVVSSSGSLLTRTLVDGSVWQTNRLDFVAPPVCEDGLECRRPDPVALNGDARPIDTARTLRNLNANERERLRREQAAARREPEVVAESKLRRLEWARSRAETMKPGASPAELEAATQRFVAMLDGGRLFGDFILTHRTGERVSVADVLADRDRWHNERFYDPIEPDHDPRVARLNLRGGETPYIYSFRHGGVRLELHAAAERLVIDAGQAPEAIDRIIERMRVDGQVFQRAGELVRVAGGEIEPVNKHWLTTYIERAFNIERYNPQTQQHEPADLPLRISERVLGARGEWGVPELAGIISYPPIRRDGTIAEDQGYDPSTGLIYSDDRERITPIALDQRGLREAIERVWRPFSMFPFIDALDRGIMLSAILTALARPTLPTAPAFLVNAYTPSTGKTLLSRCLLTINGARPSEMPLPQGNSEEIMKVLFAQLRAGTTAITFDNLEGPFRDAAFCATLTSPRPMGRILGQSSVVSVDNRCMFLLNGNNTSAAGDLYRRVLTINMDAAVEMPSKREFPFHPVHLIRSTIDVYRRDILCLFASYSAAGMPKIGAGELGSFEAWDRLVRQCVLWLRDQGALPFEIADPLDSLDRSRDEDPRHQRLRELFASWHAFAGGRELNARELKEIADADYQAPPQEMRFREALRELGRPRERDPFSTRYFGRVLRSNNGVIIDGLKLIRAHQSSKGNRWAIVLVAQARTPVEPDDDIDYFQGLDEDLPL